jgi:hypothetical protein
MCYNAISARPLLRQFNLYSSSSIYIQPEDGFLKPKHVADNCLNLRLIKVVSRFYSLFTQYHTLTNALLISCHAMPVHVPPGIVSTN